MILGGMQDAAGLDATTKSGQAQKKMEEDLNQFLNLLVTQLQNQDPLEPLDSNEFTAQLVQFASVEQQIYQNSNIEKLVAMQETGQAAAMVGYIGHRIEAKTSDLPLIDGLASGTYEHDIEVHEATLTIQNSAGDTVFYGPAETEAGRHGFNWDGKDSNGDQFPDGEYKVIVAAKNAEGVLQDVAQTAFGKVTSTSAEGGKVTLSMMGVEVDMEDILSVQ